MRNLTTGSLGEIDVRLAHRSSCGRSLFYFRLDLRWSGSPYTVLQVDLERVDKRWRHRQLEYLVRICGRGPSNRSHYVMGFPECAGCGAALRQGRRTNHAIGCVAA